MAHCSWWALGAHVVVEAGLRGEIRDMPSHSSLSREASQAVGNRTATGTEAFPSLLLLPNSSSYWRPKYWTTCNILKFTLIFNVFLKILSLLCEDYVFTVSKEPHVQYTLEQGPKPYTAQLSVKKKPDKWIHLNVIRVVLIGLLQITCSFSVTFQQFRDVTHTHRKRLGKMHIVHLQL